MEKVLPYDRTYVSQETFYWCGPASTQNVLNNRGIYRPETELARELGTTVNGTDWIGQVTNVLNNYVGGYETREMPNDPPTQVQKTQLWDDVVRSIDAGFGVVANIVAPPSNYPRGVKGSVWPSYSGGTVWHYVAIMGYDDVERAFWIADSGFAPYGYWISFDQMASLIPPKGYAFYAAAPPPPAVPEPEEQHGVLPAQVLADAMGNRLSLERYEQLAPAFTAALRAANCNTVSRVAMFCAQIGHESAGLYYMEEIASGADYEGRHDLGNVNPGDGVRYKGRGPIQITGRHNYARLSEWAYEEGHVPSPTFFVDFPEELSGTTYGFLGAVWYWTVARDMNAYADMDDINGATRAVNGGLNGIDDRVQRWRRCLAMGTQLLQFTEEDMMADRQVENYLGIGVGLEFMLAWIDKREARNEKLLSAILDNLAGEGTASRLIGEFDAPLPDKYKG